MSGNDFDGYMGLMVRMLLGIVAIVAVGSLLVYVGCLWGG